MPRPSFPRVDHPDVTDVLVATQHAGDARAQRVFVAEAADQRLRDPWPAALVAETWFASTDGEALLRYAQWAGEPEGWGVRYRRHLSMANADATERAGCLVTAVFDVDGPARQRFVADELVDSLPDGDEHGGALSTHFHLSTDGTRVFNYTEWTSEEDFRRVLARGGHDSLYDLILNTPGVRPLRGRCYLPLRTLRRPADAPER